MATRIATRSIQLLFTLAALLVATPSLAGTLTSLEVAPLQAKVGETLTATIRAQGDRCGIRVRYGDGRSQTTALTGQTTVSFSYPNAGSYEVSVVGRPHNNRPPCDGNVAGVTVTIEPGLKLERNRVQRPTLRPRSPKPKAPSGDHATSPGAGEASKANTPDVQIPDIRITRKQVTRYATLVDLALEFNLPSAKTVEFEGRSGSHIVKRSWSDVRSGQLLTIDELRPFYTYEYTITVKHRGKVRVDRSNFRTKRRVVTVHFTEVHAIDDGDDINAGDFKFSIWDPRDDTRWVLQWENGIDTGTMVVLNHSYELQNVRDPAFRIRGMVREDDPDSSFAFATEPTGSTVGIHWPFDLGSVDPRSGGTLDFSKGLSKTGSNAWELRLVGKVVVEMQ